MIIEFQDAAYESFQDVVRNLKGYTVVVTPGESIARRPTPQPDAPFIARVIGPDHNAEDGAQILVHQLDDQYEDVPDGERSVVAAKLLVF